jgi:segregation and condensation protein B
VISTLLDKRLITTAGRKEVIGRPILYKTSKEFLMRFGLSDLEELPSLKEFEALAREALGSDEGVAPSGEDYREGEAVENMVSEGGARVEDKLDGTAEAIAHVEEKLAEAEELREEEVAATSEGMPSGQLDEEPPPPAVRSTVAGE